MSANPDAAMPNETADSPPAASVEAQHKPRVALFIATAGGLGYIPVAPGTWGSLAGVGLIALFFRFHWYGAPYPLPFGEPPIFVPYLVVAGAFALLIASVGVWSADRAARFAGAEDPQFVVIDEVSGQFVTLLAGAGVT